MAILKLQLVKGGFSLIPSFWGA